MWDGGESADPEYRRRKKRTVQSVQLGNLLVVRFGGILRVSFSCRSAIW